MVLYNIRSDAEFEGGSVTMSDGQVFPFSSDHPNFKKIKEALLLGEASEDEVFTLISPFEAIFKSLVHLSDRVSRRGTTLFFDGDPLHTGIAQAIIKTIDEEGYEEGKTWPAYVAFLERLMTNPSEASRDHFYNYVEKHGLTITPEGMVVLYKGVADKNGNGEYLSVHAGYGQVSTPEGVRVYEHDRLPNKPGYVVSIPRSQVDTDRNRHCSTGLHAGTYDYAKSFAKVLLTVLVDPRDVVSVPSDYDNAKVRVARYTVLEVNEKAEPYKTGVHTSAAPTPSGDTSRVAEFEKLIETLIQSDPKVKLSVYKNKRITSARREEFAQAAANLGYKA